ncbi:MAG: saccharopine dehydrogenase NADP-binding domain-containing protein [Actinomycetota bacterium]|nr:saccharopine dehydrogenase NADP-binding domain-containing protein [Actinomycetota bacterium]
MPDILLFGATGYTGRLTARALARRGASFVIAGRNAEKLDRLAQETGAADSRVVDAGDVAGLTKALGDVRVLVTCVGPFLELGHAAVEAALRARVHYVDSSGEGPFIERLIRLRHEDALRAEIAMAPAMGFDEVPGDVAATIAADGLELPDVVLTYAVSPQTSAGTLRSGLGILSSKCRWIVDGKTTWVRPAADVRWAPLPPPLGPQAGVAFPLAIGHLAPLHLKTNGLRTYWTAGTWQRIAMRAAMPVVTTLAATEPARRLARSVIDRLPEGPTDAQREGGKWTVLAEARSGHGWRNVALTGTDVYGLTGELLATAAVRMAAPDYAEKGVLAPVPAVGLDVLRRELEAQGVRIEEYSDASVGSASDPKRTSVGSASDPKRTSVGSASDPKRTSVDSASEPKRTGKPG